MEEFHLDFNGKMDISRFFTYLYKIEQNGFIRQGCAYLNEWHYVNQSLNRKIVVHI